MNVTRYKKNINDKEIVIDFSLDMSNGIRQNATREQNKMIHNIKSIQTIDLPFIGIYTITATNIKKGVNQCRFIV